MKTWKKPAGYFVGCAVPLNAPWSASTSTLTARILPSRVAAMPPGHDVVAGERRRHQVLGPVFHPLDRLAGDDRRDDRAHVARVDADLVAEPAADVRRDDPDLVLGQAGDEGVQRAVGVRRLGGRPEGQLAVDGVPVRDRAARLHRRRVNPRVDHLLRDDDLVVGGLGLGEQGIGGRAVAGLPVEDVVVRAPLEVVTDQGRVRIERAPDVDQRREHVVLDVDQLQGVPGRVVVVRDDDGHLLALEAHLVRGEDGLHVRRQGRHPGQVLRGEVGTGDHGAHLGVCQRLACVDGDDPAVCDRRAQDRGVQHAGQPDVVDVTALTPDEARVFLASQPPEPDRPFLRLPGGCLLGAHRLGGLRRVVDGGHWPSSPLAL